MRKRGNGEGTIKKRADGRWEAQYLTGEIDSNGKKVRRSVYAKTREELSKKLISLTNSINTGVYISPSKMTVAEWMDLWVETYLVGVKESTKQQYCYNIRVHIKPKLGSVMLQKLTTPIIQNFYNESMKPHEKTRKDGSKKIVNGLSAKSIKNINGILNESLNQAVLVNYIPFNPVSACKLPRCEKVEMNVLSGDYIKKFLNEIKGKAFENLFRIDLFTGMRRSEILGLQWPDIDFEKGIIRIQRQLKCQRTPEGKNVVVYDTLKNGKSREIIVADSVLAVLMQEKKLQSERKLRAGSSFDNPDGLVFTDEIGKHLSHSTVYHAYKERVKAIGFPELRWHDLRHSYATLAISLGDDIKTVSENLGHATVSFTLDQYAHRTEEMGRSSANRLQSFIDGIGG